MKRDRLSSGKKIQTEANEKHRHRNDKCDEQQLRTQVLLRWANLPGDIDITKIPLKLMMKDVIDAVAATPRVYWEPVPVDVYYGDHMPFEDFIGAVKSHGFTNDDGHGYYATETMAMVGCYAIPSEIYKGSVPPVWATHVVWYNK